MRLLQSAVAISPQELLSYAELRSAIEVQCARQAAERATDAHIAELTGLLKRLDDDELPYPEMLEIDFRFHRKLIAVAGNPLMMNLMEVIYEFVLTQMARTTPSQRENSLGRKHEVRDSLLGLRCVVLAGDVLAGEGGRRIPNRRGRSELQRGCRAGVGGEVRGVSSA